MVNRLPRLLFAVAIALAACGIDVRGASLAVGTDGGPDASLPDGSPGGDDGGDAASDADTDAGPSPTEAVVATGVVAKASGLSTQTHLFHAENAKLYFALWVDGTNTIASASSPDLVTWTKGTSLTLPSDHGGDGRVFSVGYRSLGGTDVVHIGIALHATSPTSTELDHYHARATVQAGALVFGTVDFVSSVTDSKFQDPDGIVTQIDANGTVTEASGWVDESGPENAVIFYSLSDDKGASWSSGFFGGELVQVASHIVNSKSIVDVGSGTSLMIFESADVEPDPQNLRWSKVTATSVTPSAALFAAAPQDFGDWAVARAGATDVQVVRRTLAGTLEHVRWNGTSWTPAVNVPADPTLSRSGLGFAVAGSHLALVAISSDASNAVRENRWNGSAWGTWKTIEAAPHARTGLTTCQCGSAKPAVMYLRGTDLVVLPLSATP